MPSAVAFGAALSVGAVRAGFRRGASAALHVGSEFNQKPVPVILILNQKPVPVIPCERGSAVARAPPCTLVQNSIKNLSP